MLTGRKQSAVPHQICPDEAGFTTLSHSLLITSMALLRVFDNVCLAFYIMSLLVAVAVDSQAVLPAAYYPDVFRGVLTWHIETNRDFLMGNPPTWFKSLCYCELLLQTPFYLLAIFAYTSRASWIRLPALAYGVHVATTMVPIFAELLAAPPAGRWDLVAIYVPFAVVPLLIAVRMAADPQPFSARQAALLPAKRD